MQTHWIFPLLQSEHCQTPVHAFTGAMGLPIKIFAIVGKANPMIFK